MSGPKRNVMILSHSRQFIFLKSRKTAGTSLETALSNCCSGSDVVTPLGAYEFNKDHTGKWQHRAMNVGDFHQHDEALTIRHLVGDATWNRYHKFSITRNPWDRVVSLFTWRTRRQRKDAAPAPGSAAEAGLDELRNLFRDYVRSDWETNDGFYFIDGKLCVDQVLRYERLHDDVVDLCQRIGIPPIELPRLKTGFRSGHHYSAYYDDETRRIVAERHANDIREFGYRYETE
jgi:hypothetical protein